jgi:hypothetical protein
MMHTPRVVRIFAAGCLSLGLMGARASAEPILLTFDELSPGIYPSTVYGHYGVYLGSGIHFPGGGAGITEISIAASDTAVSGQNILMPRPTRSGTYTDILGVFFAPRSNLYTDFLSMTISGAGSLGEPWEVRIFGDYGYLETFAGVGNQVFSVSRQTRDILGFEFLGTGTQGLDNLSIGELTAGSFVATPEPGTLALFGLGLAGLVRAARKRARPKD